MTYARMKVFTTRGLVTVEVEDSWEASDVSAYWNAVQRYLNTGDDSGLWPFEGESIHGHVFQTDLDVIEEEARRGELSFEDIYEG